MTDQALHDAILADAQAKALADAGNDAGGAVRMAAALPPVLVSTYVNERGVFAAFADPADAEAVMQGLEAVAAGNPNASPPLAPNPVVKRVLDWMAPNNGGLDLSFPSVRGMLDQFAAAGVLTAAAVGALKSLAQRPAAVDPAQVGRAWAQYRPNGRIA